MEMTLNYNCPTLLVLLSLALYLLQITHNFQLKNELLVNEALILYVVSNKS